MTDGGIYIDNNRVESKKFNIKDGLGIQLAHSAGIDFLVLTGRKSNCVEQRIKDKVSCSGNAVTACPADAAEKVKAYCDYVLSKKGGQGAVREFIEIILKEQNLSKKHY
ncbi:hypothetical protein FACS189476_01690 [Spirochaetia bacterium]|nr:hypothetical protein FACS189476_01690 [Spirochaetia bacterium]